MAETMVPLSWLTRAQERAAVAEQQLAALRRRRYRFVGRNGNTYIWEAVLATDSRVERITCSVEWFWGTEFLTYRTEQDYWDAMEVTG